MYENASGAGNVAAGVGVGAGAGTEAQIPNAGKYPLFRVRGRETAIDGGDRGLGPPTVLRLRTQSVGKGGNEKTRTAKGVRVKRGSDGSGKKGRRRRRKRRKRCVWSLPFTLSVLITVRLEEIWCERHSAMGQIWNHLRS
jgi:hypothetical protein